MKYQPVFRVYSFEATSTGATAAAAATAAVADTRADQQTPTISWQSSVVVDISTPDRVWGGERSGEERGVGRRGGRRGSGEKGGEEKERWETGGKERGMEMRRGGRKGGKLRRGRGGGDASGWSRSYCNTSMTAGMREDTRSAQPSVWPSAPQKHSP